MVARRLVALSIVVAATLPFGCGAPPASPIAPPPTPPVFTPPPANNVPVIDSITIQGTRSQEPPSFADLSEPVGVVAKVHDDETAADKLDYQWSATVGTFSGTGASVVWQAPPAAATPLDVAFTLKVVEKYGQPGGSLDFSHEVTGTAALSLHDSAKEVGDMARQFLLDFSDSNIRDVKFIMRNFADVTPACIQGHDSEVEDVERNRVDYRIFQSFVGTPAVTVKFNTLCPFRLKGADACAQVPVEWRSTRLTEPTVLGGTPKGGSERAVGIDQVTAIYIRSAKKWGLCESDFNPLESLAVGSTFIR